jgi:hypothetical protein
LVVENLTLQTYKRRRTCKAGQVMLIEYAFDLDVELCFLVAILILQLDLDVTPELIVLCEHRYHRDLYFSLC